jgi:hypothetical protein
MTVHAVSKDGKKITCQWFEGYTLNKEIFDRQEIIHSRITNGKTHVVQIMDGSGSMSGIWSEINGMLRQQFEIHKKAASEGQDVRLTTFVFDSKVYEPVLNSQDPKNAEFPILTMPGGMTALRDAIGYGIKLVKEKFTDEPNEAVLVQIFTDGMENQSREWTHEAIHNEIKRLQDSGRWTFQFIGANQIAEDTAFHLGIKSGNAIRFNATKSGVRGMSAGLIGSTYSYYGARAGGVCSVDKSFGSDETGKVFEDEPETV